MVVSYAVMKWSASRSFRSSSPLGIAVRARVMQQKGRGVRGLLRSKIGLVESDQRLSHLIYCEIPCSSLNKHLKSHTVAIE